MRREDESPWKLISRGLKSEMRANEIRAWKIHNKKAHEAKNEKSSRIYENWNVIQHDFKGHKFLYTQNDDINIIKCSRG